MVGKIVAAARWAGARAGDALRDAGLLCGGGLMSYGAWLVYQPAGFITGGILLIGLSLLSSGGDAGKPSA